MSKSFLNELNGACEGSFKRWLAGINSGWVLCEDQYHPVSKEVGGVHDCRVNLLALSRLPEINQEL